MRLNIEIWKSVLGYEGIYEVSNLGNVRSIDRVVKSSNGSECFRKGKLLAKTLDKDGYQTVHLMQFGVGRRSKIARLVSIAFIPNPLEKPEINHIDFDRTNNCVSNLEWVTHKENIKHLMSAGRHYTQTTNINGSNNPNYGNRTLSMKYKNNPSLSKEKNARHGSSNGMAKPITITDHTGNNAFKFQCIKDCAKYIINEGFSISNNIACVSAKISKAANNNSIEFGHCFKF